MDKESFEAWAVESEHGLIAGGPRSIHHSRGAAFEAAAKLSESRVAAVKLDVVRVRVTVEVIEPAQ